MQCRAHLYIFVRRLATNPSRGAFIHRRPLQKGEMHFWWVVSFWRLQLTTLQFSMEAHHEALKRTIPKQEIIIFRVSIFCKIGWHFTKLVKNILFGSLITLPSNNGTGALERLDLSTKVMADDALLCCHPYNVFAGKSMVNLFFCIQD